MVQPHPLPSGLIAQPAALCPSALILSVAGGAEAMEKVRWIPVASPRGWNRFEIAGVLAAFVLFSCTVAMGQKPEYAGIRVPAVAGSARITPSPSASSEKASVVLPLEVLGPDGTTVTARFNIPDGPDLNKRLKLWLEIHALKYETEASLQINGGEVDPDQ